MSPKYELLDPAPGRSLVFVKDLTGPTVGDTHYLPREKYEASQSVPRQPRPTRDQVKAKIRTQEANVLLALRDTQRPLCKDRMLEVLDQIKPLTNRDYWHGNVLDSSLLPDGKLWLTDEIVSIGDVTETRKGVLANTFILKENATPEQIAASRIRRNIQLREKIAKIQRQYEEDIAKVRSLLTTETAI